MPRFLTLAKYSAIGAAGIHREGFEARVQTLNDYLAALGGRVVDFYVTPQGEYDIAMIYEVDQMTPGLAVAQDILSRSSGAYDKVTSMSLVSPREADEARSHLPGFKAPGQ